MPVDDPKPEPYQYQPYPAVRYHREHAPETVLDADHEISVCGEICDTKNGTANKQGWRNRPYTEEELTAPEPKSEPKQEQQKQPQEPKRK